MIEENQICVSKNESLQAEKVLSRAELRKSILSFTWPCIAELMLVSMISIINLAMVGHLGAYAITSVGLTNQPVMVSVAVFQAFNVGATAMVARFVGAKDYENAKKVVIQALIIAVISGSVLCILGFSFSRWIVVTMGAQDDTVDYASMYMKYMSVGIIFQAIPTVVTSLLRGAGDTRSPMRYNIISNIVNVLAGFIMIYGLWFIPAMGIEGAAIATTLAKFSACALSIYTIITSSLPVAVSIRDKFRLDFLMLKRIMNIGLAAAVEQLILRTGFVIFTMVVAELGTVSFAAYQISESITGLSINFSLALGMASTSFMGRNLGAKKPEMAEAYCDELRKIALSASMIISACFFFGGYYITRIFTTDMEVILLTALLMKVIAFMVPFQNSQLVLSGGLRGAGDTKWPLFAVISGIVFVRVPLAIILIKFLHFGVWAASLAGVIDQLARSIVVYFRFRDGKWKLVKV
mgnify:CR=1 FL=1